MKIPGSTSTATTTARTLQVMAAALARSVAGVPPCAVWPWPVPPTNRR